MAKLYYRHGAMSSAKTLNLLAAAHSYEVQSKKVLVMKPQLDDRFGKCTVKSRAGLGREADQLLTEETTFPAESLRDISCILVDEAQFLHPRVIERLRDVTTQCGVPVMCYGLRTDFRSRLFPGSKRLLELADTIEEIKTTCSWCNKKAIMNLKAVGGKATMEGPTVCLGAEEMYSPACYTHFQSQISTATGRPIDFPVAWAAGDKADLEASQQKGDAEKELCPAAKRIRTEEPDTELSPAKA
jgi:thymidine kinase